MYTFLIFLCSLCQAHNEVLAFSEALQILGVFVKIPHDSTPSLIVHVGVGTLVQCTTMRTAPSLYLVPCTYPCQQVARSLDKLDKAQTWLMLKLLYCGSDPECSTLGLIQTKSTVCRSTTGSRLSNVQVCIST